MVPFPTECPVCNAKGIAYSVGVIRNRTAAQLREYPVVWCERCATAYFTRPPFTIWQRCGVNKRVMAFTKDPDAIDRSLKLEYDFKLIGGVEIYSVYPVSQGDTQV